MSNKLLSKLFETTNPSGASCLSRCLIYKVHAASLSSGDYHTTSFPLCQVLFLVFSNFFALASCFLCGLLLSQQFCILPHPRIFVKNFFQLFQSFLSFFRLCCVVYAVLADSLAIISPSSTFVNSFFQIFLFFPKFLIYSQKHPNFRLKHPLDADI